MGLPPPHSRIHYKHILWCDVSNKKDVMFHISDLSLIMLKFNCPNMLIIDMWKSTDSTVPRFGGNICSSLMKLILLIYRFSTTTTTKTRHPPNPGSGEDTFEPFIELFYNLAFFMSLGNRNGSPTAAQGCGSGYGQIQIILPDPDP